MGKNQVGEVMVKDAGIIIAVDVKYYRNQFDDWLAGGKVEYS